MEQTSVEEDVIGLRTTARKEPSFSAVCKPLVISDPLRPNMAIVSAAETVAGGYWVRNRVYFLQLTMPRRWLILNS